MKVKKIKAHRIKFFKKRLIVKIIQNWCIEVVYKSKIKPRLLNFNIKREFLKPVIKFLFQNSLLKFQQLTDLTVYDRLSNTYRFTINYWLLSLAFNKRILLSLHADEVTTIPSLQNLFFRNSDWLERESWDLYGIRFIGHKDLRRILTDYGFVGHPFRLDYPVSGYIELRYNDAANCIEYKNVSRVSQLRQLRVSSQSW